MAPHENFTEEKIRKEALFAETKAEVTSIQEDDEDEYIDYDEDTSSPDTTIAGKGDSEENNTTLSLANESVEQEMKWFNDVSKK